MIFGGILIIDIILTGMFIGGVYGLMALGFSLIFSGMRNSVNLLYGQLCVLGSYLSLAIVRWLKIDPLLSLVVVLPLIFCLTYVLQYVFFNKVVLGEHGTYLLVSLGSALIVENLLIICFSPEVVSLAAYAPYSLGYIKIYGIHLPTIYLIAFSTSILCCILLYLFLKYTYVGRAIRATSENYIYAQLFAVNYKTIFAVTFGLASLMAAMSGIIVGLIYPFTPGYGFSYLELAFFAVIVGGMGSMRGSIAGGLVVGIVRTLATYYLGIPYAKFIGNVVTLIILYIRPQGIFGYKV
jgi:branched-chain amino acid transport system permease protein